jgi:hypothetical protein
MSDELDDDLAGLSPFAPPELIEEAKARAAKNKKSVEPAAPEEPIVEEPPVSLTKPVVAEATVTVNTGELVELAEEPVAPAAEEPAVVLPPVNISLTKRTPVVDDDGIELADAPLTLLQPKAAAPAVNIAPSAPIEAEATIIASSNRPAEPTEETFVASNPVTNTASAPVAPVTAATPVVEEESEIISTREPVDARRANAEVREQGIRTAPISETYERREIRPEVTRVSAQGRSREALWQENAKKQRKASSRVLVWIIVVAAVLGSAAAIGITVLTS